ncbi:MAG: acetamidase/formamidase family protein [Nitriliruptoraceae bacterium]
MARLAGRQARHYGWDRDRPPAALVASGDVVTLSLVDAFDGQLTPAAEAADVTALDLTRANPLTGPVKVDGARVGDAVVVELLDITVDATGWTAIIPGFGLLADDFDDPHVIVSTRTDEDVAFGDVARLHLRPFVGTVGLAPAEPGEHDVIPPRDVGGNLDCRDVAAGTRLWLPVAVDGALLSLGDAHMTQGDGEVCGTAIETAATVTARVHVVDGAAPSTPRVEVSRFADRAVVIGAKRHELTTGVGPDLYAAARDATRAMIEQLTRNGLSAADAYALCSVAGHLRVIEVVDAPNWVVGMQLSY